jgi:acylglycerol lipase
MNPQTVPTQTASSQNLDPQEFTFLGQENYRMVYQIITPPVQPRAVVLVVHGNSEHQGRYLHVRQALAARGFLVYSYDHRGHGKSEGIQGDVKQFQDFVLDMASMIKIIKADQPALKLFMIAHSLGGLIATHYLMDHQEQFAGAVLSSPALDIGSDVSEFIKKISPFVAKLLPLVPITESNRQKESALSRDLEIQRLFDADPLCYQGKIRARYGYELLKAAQSLVGRGRDLVLPLLIQHGGEDKLVNPGPTKAMFERVRSSDKTFRVWEGARHEVFNELEKVKTIEFVGDWLEERV